MNNRWPGQHIFIERVKRYAMERGFVTARGAVRLDLVSDYFGISESLLRQCLQWKSMSRPHYYTLAYIAGVIGYPVSDFLDDPGSPIQGMSNDEWTELSEKERAFLKRVYTDLTDNDLSSAEKDALFAGYEEMLSRFFQLREMWRIESDVNSQ